MSRRETSLKIRTTCNRLATGIGFCDMVYTWKRCGLVLLVLLEIMSAKAEYNHSMEDSCTHYDKCWQCVQDPCSRRHDVTNGCFWCSNFLRGGSGCIPVFQAQSCEHPVHDTRGCLSSDPSWVQDQLEPDLAGNFSCVHSDYTIAFPTGDIFASQNQGNSRNDVWINMRDRLQNSRVVNLCGDFSPIEVIQQVGSDSEICWDLGEVTARPKCKVVEDQYPGKGVTVWYGQTSCCPIENVGAGNYIEIDVTITMIADNTNGSQESSFLQTIGNLSILTGCSRDDSVNAVIATSQLSDINIDWRLDVTTSRLQCKQNSEVHDELGEVLPCKICPEPVVRGHNVSWELCKKHFTVQLFYHNSTTVVYDLAHFQTWDDDVHYFLVPLANLKGFEVDYSYSHGRPEPVTGGISNPVIFSNKSSGLPEWSIAVIAITSIVVVALLVAAICLGFREWKRRHYKPIDPREDYASQQDA